MKKINYLVLLLAAVTVFACSNETEKSETSASNEMIVNGKTLATIHNECLANIYDSLTTQKKTRAMDLHSDTFKARVISLATEYISKHTSNTRADGFDADFSVLDMSTSDIMNNMSDRELYYINETLESGTNIEDLLLKASNDEMLQPINKQAVISYITTFAASSEYWNLHIDEWAELFNAEKTRASFSWRDAAVADAFYGYQTMLMSGFNLYVSGGVAAVGSVLSGLR